MHGPSAERPCASSLALSRASLLLPYISQSHTPVEPNRILPHGDRKAGRESASSRTVTVVRLVLVAADLRDPLDPPLTCRARPTAGADVVRRCCSLSRARCTRARPSSPAQAGGPGPKIIDILLTCR